MRDSLMCLKIHSTHGSKHATIPAMRLAGLHLENLSKQSLLGTIPKKASHTTTKKPANCNTTLGGR